MRYLPIPLAFAALLLLPGSPRTGIAQERAPAARTAPSDPAELRKELEVMRRILHRSVGGRVDSTSVHGGIYTHLNRGQYVSSEAYYVGGDGATFVLRTGTPVAPGSEKPKEPDAEPTLWDEVLADVEGRPNPRERDASKYVYDAARVKELETSVLDALGRYVANLSQLGDAEHVTVVIAGPSPHGATPGLRVVGEQSSLALLFAGSQGHGSTAGTVLTIRVTRADCAARADGRLDADAFRARAVLHRY